MRRSVTGTGEPASAERSCLAARPRTLSCRAEHFGPPETQLLWCWALGSCSEILARTERQEGTTHAHRTSCSWAAVTGLRACTVEIPNHVGLHPPKPLLHKQCCIALRRPLSTHHRDGAIAAMAVIIPSDAHSCRWHNSKRAGPQPMRSPTRPTPVLALRWAAWALGAAVLCNRHAVPQVTSKPRLLLNAGSLPLAPPAPLTHTQNRGPTQRVIRGAQLLL